VKQKQSKAINMRYHWIRDQVDLDLFTIEWEPGVDNLADYFTKNHPVHHHQKMRNVTLYVYDNPQVKLAHVCVLAVLNAVPVYADPNNLFAALAT